MWYYQNKIFDPKQDELDPKDVYGFVYLITNKKTGRKYIGKKVMWNKTKRKGKRALVESDWREYYGSSRQLNEDRDEIGSDEFHREILHFCKNKAECAYMELREQILQEALLRDDFYNGFVGGKIGRRGLDRLAKMLVS